MGMGKSESEKKILEAPINEVLSVLADENKKRRQSRNALNWCIGVGFGILALAQIVLWIKGRGMLDFQSLSSIFVVFGAGAAFTGMHRAALQRTEELATPESAGFLIEAYATSEEKDVKEVCERALIKALPLVESADTFDDYQRGLLYKTLRRTKNLELAEAIIDVARRIGGREAIPYLEDFRTSAEKRKGAGWERISLKALSSLPDLRVRVARAIIEQRVREDEERSMAVQELR